VSLIAALCAGAVAQEGIWEPNPARLPASLAAADPMAAFARMVSGEWKRTVQSGTSTFDTWHWGPGKHSLRVMTHGLAASGDPWRELGVVYWHPGRKQVCLLGLDPYQHSVAEGTIRFQGEVVEAALDLYQTRARRKLRRRWAFEGPDRYRSSLLESTGRGGFSPLAEWDYIRSRTLTPVSPPSAGASPKLPESLKPLGSLLGHTWDTEGEATGEWAAQAAPHLRSSLEWVPYADGIYVRTSALTRGAEPNHLLDAYVYHHTGASVLRCLALSRAGGVYEGDVRVLDGGALEIDLKGYEGARAVTHLTRIDFENDKTLRQRVWSVDGTRRTLLLDVHHKQLESRKD